ncbi:NUDIX hydrolase [Bowmanella dokdonensis]|uniref:Nudix hydrolase domain-containing protein n=1 Tax=Bowmanella dokdonensis TaxID=751969 RepID=A0A939DL66_9ALTE|nr:hypothetical protein [Bowmanella dokdonensis]MBN7824677.1 hypothetical protein [Bowmanella dokdonensis]
MLRLLTLLIALLGAQALCAKQDVTPSTFHRLLVFNHSNELLVVKIKDRELWVTPGWYQDQENTIRQGLTELAGSYGLKIVDPSLRGVFVLLMGQQQKTSTRLIHVAIVQKPDIQLPEGIDQARWLPVDQALELINLPHIRYKIEQITAHPDTVWGGTQKMHWEDGVNKFEVVEEFYPLFSVGAGK